MKKFTIIEFTNVKTNLKMGFNGKVDLQKQMANFCKNVRFIFVRDVLTRQKMININN